MTDTDDPTRAGRPSAWAVDDDLEAAADTAMLELSNELAHTEVPS